MDELADGEPALLLLVQDLLLPDEARPRTTAAASTSTEATCWAPEEVRTPFAEQEKGSVVRGFSPSVTWMVNGEVGLLRLLLLLSIAVVPRLDGKRRTRGSESEFSEPSKAEDEDASGEEGGVKDAASSGLESGLGLRRLAACAAAFTLLYLKYMSVYLSSKEQKESNGR